MKPTKKSPLFIHSLFRTGSTYIWHKFRRQDRCHCYYEPLHQVLANVTPDNLERALTTDFASAHHPELDKYYLYEYRELLAEAGTDTPKGLPYFKPAFSFDQFCHTGDNPDFKQYVDFLARGAKDKPPLYQFNRTALRTRWFKNNYPDSVNIYLLRDPRDQWQSYLELSKRTGYPSFFAMDLTAVSLNAGKPPLRYLARHLPLLTFPQPPAKEEIDFYTLVQEAYTPKNRYLVFYYLWLSALCHNLLYADLIVDMNRLGESTQYRAKIASHLQGLGHPPPDFSDCRVRRCQSYCEEIEAMEKIEADAAVVLFSHMEKADFSALTAKLDAPDFATPYLNKELCQKSRLSPQKTHLPSVNTKRQFKDLIMSLARHFIDKSQEFAVLQRDLSMEGYRDKQKISRLREEVNMLEQQIEQLTNDLEKLNASYQASQSRVQELEQQLNNMQNTLSWRLTAPFRRFKKGAKNNRTP